MDCAVGRGEFGVFAVDVEYSVGDYVVPRPMAGSPSVYEGVDAEPVVLAGTAIGDATEGVGGGDFIMQVRHGGVADDGGVGQGEVGVGAGPFGPADAGGVSEGSSGREGRRVVGGERDADEVGHGGVASALHGAEVEVEKSLPGVRAD